MGGNEIIGEGFFGCSRIELDVQSGCQESWRAWGYAQTHPRKSLCSYIDVLGFSVEGGDPHRFRATLGQ